MNQVENKRDTHKRFSHLVFKRDGFRCVYCGKSSIEDGVKLCIDHIDPEYNDENNKMLNLITSCNECNLLKGNKKLDRGIVSRIVKRSSELMTVMSQELIKEAEEHFSKYYINEKCLCGKKIIESSIRYFDYGTDKYFMYKCKKCGIKFIEKIPQFNGRYNIRKLLGFISDNLIYYPVQDYWETSQLLNHIGVNTRFV